MCKKIFLSMIILAFCFVPLAGADNQMDKLSVKPTPQELGVNKEIWITTRADNQPGTGTNNDPFNGSTQAKFDGIMNGLWKSGAKNVTIHLGVGTFETFGSYSSAAYAPTPGWRMLDGWKIIGAGMGNTIVKLAGFTYENPQPLGVTVSNGLWTATGDLWSYGSGSGSFEVGQEIRLANGTNPTGLTLNTVYYVSEVIDPKNFKVSATSGGATITNAAIGSAGQYKIISKDSGGCVFATEPWNKLDQEIRDLTVDANWTGFGTALTDTFIVPAEMATVTVNVESSTWALDKVGKRVYIQQLDYTPVGVYAVVSVPSGTQIELRNLSAKFTDPAYRPTGTVVANFAKVCPRMNTAGVSLVARRAKIERVRVTNGGSPISEGGGGITVGGVGQPGPNWPAASEIVIRDCIVDNIWGQSAWPIQVLGNNVDWPSKGYGTQALVEGNTIYGNGLHQGLGGFNYVNSVWINNKVVNCIASFFTDTAHTWNNIIKNNMFLECKSYTMNIGGGPAMWKQDSKYKSGDMAVWDDLYYTCKTENTGQTPPNDAYWEKTPKQELNGYNSYIIEDNIIEICDKSGPLLFNGDVVNTIFRNNILRYATGQGRGSYGLEFSKPTNRGLVVTGNVIDSRLKCNVGKSVVFGKDNIDEKGHLRPELEIGERVGGGEAIFPPDGQKN